MKNCLWILIFRSISKRKTVGDLLVLLLWNPISLITISPHGRERRRGQGVKSHKVFGGYTTYNLEKRPFYDRRGITKGNFYGFAEKGRGLDVQEPLIVAPLKVIGSIVGPFNANETGGQFSNFKTWAKTCFYWFLYTWLSLFSGPKK